MIYKEIMHRALSFILKKTKFLISIFFIIILFGACVKEEIPLEANHLITIEQAIQFALDNHNDSIKEEASKRTNSFIVLDSISLANDNGVPSLYIINYQVNNENFFTIVSADNRTLPIVGYGSETISINEINKELEYWLNGQIDLIEYVRDNNITKNYFVSTIANINVIDDGPIGLCDGQPNGLIGWTIQGPLLNNTWGQGCVYNEHCPDLNCSINPCMSEEALVGCVATAIAQIMGYHQSPNNYNWASIQTRYLGNDFNLPGADEIATIMSDAGNSVNMNYGCIASGVPVNVYPTVVPDAFENVFGYSNGGQYISNSFPDFGWNDWVSIKGNI